MARVEPQPQPPPQRQPPSAWGSDRDELAQSLPSSSASGSGSGEQTQRGPSGSLADDDPQGGPRHPEIKRAWRAQASRGGNTSGDALVYNGHSVTPQVLSNFLPYDSGSSGVGVQVTSSGAEFALEEQVEALRNGEAVLGWTLCNPFCDSRLSRSLWPLFLNVIALVMLLSSSCFAICRWTSAAASPAGEGTMAVPIECGPSRTSRELKALLLSIDVPFFVCLGAGHSLAMANLARSPQWLRYVAITGAEMAVLSLAGSLVVAFCKPHTIWGAKGSVGFAGIWVMVENFAGIVTLTVQLSSGGVEQRIVQSKASVACFGVILLSSAFASHGMYYLVEFFAASGVHELAGLICLFVVTAAVLQAVKASVRHWLKVPALACALWLYWFQAGAYMSFRMFLQEVEGVAMVASTALCAGAAELGLRLSMVITAKFLHNFHARKGNFEMALRVLDVLIATLFVDIVAEWAAISVAAVLGLAADPEVFDRLRIFRSVGDSALTIGIQTSVEALADVLSLFISFSLLPVSLEGICGARGFWMLEASCFVVSLIFIFSILNLRIRIDCFL